MASLKTKTVFCLFYAVLLFISGILCIGFAVVLAYKLFYHSSFIPSGSVGPFFLLALLGFIHLLLTWLAIKAPTRKHDCHLILFLIITGFLLVVECATGVWNIMLRDEVDVEILLILIESFKTVIDNDFNKNSDWNKLQQKMKCCGLNGIGDYKTTKGSFPVSCCEDQTGPNITCYDVSCRQPLSQYVKTIQFNGAIISFSGCILQVMGLLIFYSFFKTLKADRAAKRANLSEIQKEIAEQSNSSSMQMRDTVSNSNELRNKQLNRTPLHNDKGTSGRRKSKGMAPSAPPRIA